MRQLILEDLRVIKTLCVPCFPPDYHILKEYVKMYHRAVSKFVRIYKVILKKNLNKIILD